MSQTTWYFHSLFVQCTSPHMDVETCKGTIVTLMQCCIAAKMNTRHPFLDADVFFLGNLDVEPLLKSQMVYCIIYSKQIFDSVFNKNNITYIFFIPSKNTMLYNFRTITVNSFYITTLYRVR